MIICACKQCGKTFERRGSKPGVFCSLDCKGEWQKTQKPVDREWLYQKYIVEGLGAYQIAKLVNRNPSQVHNWLKGYDLPIRHREWDITPGTQLFHNEDWLRWEYVLNQRSASEIASQFGVTAVDILFFLHKFGIQIRGMSDVRAVKYWGQSGKQNPMFGKRGGDSPNWKGGLTPERQSLYSSIEWKQAVAVVWARDHEMCQRCRTMKSRFVIHHIAPFSCKELRADPSNLIVLCTKCHGWVHSKKNVNKEYIRDPHHIQKETDLRDLPLFQGVGD